MFFSVSSLFTWSKCIQQFFELVRRWSHTVAESCQIRYHISHVCDYLSSSGNQPRIGFTESASHALYITYYFICVLSFVNHNIYRTHGCTDHHTRANSRPVLCHTQHICQKIAPFPLRSKTNTVEEVQQDPDPKASAEANIEMQSNPSLGMPIMNDKVSSSSMAGGLKVAHSRAGLPLDQTQILDLTQPLAPNGCI